MSHGARPGRSTQGDTVHSLAISRFREAVSKCVAFLAVAIAVGGSMTVLTHRDSTRSSSLLHQFDPGLGLACAANPLGCESIRLSLQIEALVRDLKGTVMTLRSAQQLSEGQNDGAGRESHPHEAAAPAPHPGAEEAVEGGP